MSDEYDFLFKSIVVGDGGVGKTALTLRFSKGFFTEDYKMTIGVDFHVKTIAIDTDQGPLRAKLQIWDTGGQERFSSIRPMYYRGSLGALLIFDLTNYETFEHLPQWIEEVRANVRNEIPLLLVGNKSDLLDQRSVSMDELNDFTGKFNLYYMETSAKTGVGVGDCFSILACLMVGSGVPDQFLAGGVVSNPGEITSVGVASVMAAAPPVPASVAKFEPEPVPIPALEPEPEFEFDAPPVPVARFEPEPVPIPALEPEPEFEFDAPPVPEPVATFEPAPVMQTEPEIDFSAIDFPADDELHDIKFKLPDEILSAEPGTSFTALPEAPDALESTKYTPKAVPFSSNVPIPAPAPEGFPIPSNSSSKSSAPFLITKRPESSKPKPASMTFETPASPTFEPTPIFPTPGGDSPHSIPFSTEPSSSSESLLDYMPETILSKKERKKLEKQKKKDEKEQARLDKERKIAEAKEKLQLEKEKEAEEIQRAREEAIRAKEEAKKSKKEKPVKEIPVKEKPVKEKPVKEKPVKEKPVKEKKSKEKKETEKPAEAGLFQSLSQKTEPMKPSAFVPFMATSQAGGSESSKLRIIPNVADIDITPIPSAPEPDFSAPIPQKKEKRKEIRICSQCGAMLSTDYAFCNKCGGKL